MKVKEDSMSIFKNDYSEYYLKFNFSLTYQNNLSAESGFEWNI